MISKPEPDCLDAPREASRVCHAQEADPPHLPGLRLGGERRGEEAARGSRDEGAAIHYSIT